VKQIGVGVEGPSDLRFWRKVLHRCLGQHGLIRFDVHNMSGRPKLVRDADRLLDVFRGAGYSAGLLVLDLDKNPCVEDLRDQFSERVQGELRATGDNRYLHLAAAVRKLESWYLADPDAVRAVIPGADYTGAGYDSRWGKGKLGEICERGGSLYNELLFAEQIAPHYSPERASELSDSMRLAWERIMRAASRAG